METILRSHEINQTHNNFIGGWFIDPKVCDYLLNVYNDPRTIKNPGCSADPDKPNPEIKDSMDAIFNPSEPTIIPYLQQLDLCVKQYVNLWASVRNSNVYTKMTEQDKKTLENKAGDGVDVFNSLNP
jgi:hypothetical protein